MSMVDLSPVGLVRFCPRCDELTFWDGPGTRELMCIHTRDGEDSHCGFTLGTALSDAEQERFDVYARRLNPVRPSRGYEFV